ncbi:MAG TPA: ATP-binding protein [Marmoricola sp.]|nr:ATP-binding protein [Marmoricola sp.]
MNLPIRVRLTAWYAALLTVILVALGTFIVLQMRTALVKAIDDRTMISSIELEKSLIDDADDSDDPVERQEDFEEDARAILSPSAGGALVLDAEGRTVMPYWFDSSDGPELPDAVRSGALAGEPQTLTLASERAGHRYRARVSPLHIGGDIRLLLVAESLQPVEHAVGEVTTLLLVAGPAALLITGVAAFWIASKAVEPVVRITSDANEIGIDHLHDRVAVPSSRDETRRLAETLNAMLARIERGVVEKHRLLADTSHELRTPLAIMRSEIDVALADDEWSEPGRAVLVSAREEVDRMSRMTDNMLTSAQADEGRLELLTSWVDLRRLIDDAVRGLAPLAVSKGVRLVVEGEHQEVQVDALRIQLVLTNLVDNAIKYSPAEGTVQITSWRQDEELGVTVTDQGPGISESDVEHLFERYYRSEDPRTTHLTGSGLGLAICRQVVVAHGGRLWAERLTGGGSAFSFALPSRRASDPAAASAGSQVAPRNNGRSPLSTTPQTTRPPSVT